MGDAENVPPPSKKRVAGRELSRDNPGLDDEEDTSEQETGTFKKASEDVLATRRIVKVRRQQSSAAPSSNPFAGIRLVPSAAPSVTTADDAAAVEKTENPNDNSSAQNKSAEDKAENDNLSETKADVAVAESGTNKENSGIASQATEKEVAHEKAGDSKIHSEDKDDKNSEASKNEVDKGGNDKDGEDSRATNENREDNKNEERKPEIDDQKGTRGDKTQNQDGKDNAGEGTTESAPLGAFQSLSSSQNAFTGLAGTGFSSSMFSFGTIPKDGSSSGAASGTLFGQSSGQSSPFTFAFSNNGSSSLFGSASAPILPKTEGTTTMKQVTVETGEENEKVVFAADSVLFEFLDGTWKERGKGELKVNVSTMDTEKARLVMRAKGNYRLILNASLYPEMKLTNMDKKGITFACVNSTSDGKSGLSTFAAKFKDSSIVEEFCVAVMEHKGKAATPPKTPENSPKASDS